MQRFKTILFLSALLLMSSLAFSRQIRDLKSTSQHADYLVITVDSFVNAVTPLLNHRSGTTAFDDVDDPAVVTVEDIYAAFPTEKWPHQKIHEFLRYAYAHWTDSIKYVLFLGRGETGPDKNQPKGLVPYFPARVEGIRKSYDFVNKDSVWVSTLGNSSNLDSLISVVFFPVDYYYASPIYVKDTLRTSSDSSDKSNPNRLIARVPAISRQDVEYFVQKTIQWDTAVGQCHDRIGNLFIADNNVQLSYYDQAGYWANEAEKIQTSAAGSNRSSIPLKFYTLEYPTDPSRSRYPDSVKTKLTGFFNQKPGIVQMLGHSGFNQFTSEAIIKYPDDLDRINNISGSFLLNFIACETMEESYDLQFPTVPGDRGIAPAMLLNRPVGAVAVIGNNKLGENGSISQFNKLFYPQIYSGSGKSIAEIVLSTMISQGFNMNTYRRFGFMGDPALRFCNVAGTIDTFQVDRNGDGLSVNINVTHSSLSGPYEYSLIGYSKGEMATDSHPLYNRLNYWKSPERKVVKTVTESGSSFNGTFPFSLTTEEAQGVNLLGFYIRGAGWDIFRVFELDSALAAVAIENVPAKEPEAQGISAVPNPFNPRTTLTFPNPEHKATITLFNIAGKRIAEFRNVTANRMEWNAQGFPSGVYFVKVLTGTRCLQKRINFIR